MLVKINNVIIETNNIAGIAPYIEKNTLTPSAGLIVNGARLPIYKDFDNYDGQTMRSILKSLDDLIEKMFTGYEIKNLKAKDIKQKE